jgi:urea carboxylase
MWNRDRQTDVFTKPWLLRFFDQIRFYEVSAEELLEIREHFPWGDYPLRIEEEEFSLDDYQQLLEQEAETIDTFQQQRQHAFDEELARWRAEGQFTFDSALDEAPSNEEYIPDSCCGVESQVAGSVWQWLVEPGEQVSAGQTIGILESMKMEIPITSPVDGVIRTFQRQQGHQVHAGQLLMVIETAA